MRAPQHKTLSLTLTLVSSLAGVPSLHARTGGPGTVLDASSVHKYFDEKDETRLVPLLQEVLRFPTLSGNDAAHADQKAWLLRTAKALGLVARDAGLVTEIDLPGPEGAPVLGLIIHGDVQPVDEKAWSVPPFGGIVRDASVWGRGAADDKAPLVQALLAMHALRERGPARTHTIRLIVGSDEESTNLDMASYLKEHEAPAYSLVLDALFPVVVGEKAWNALRVSVDPKADTPAAGAAWDVVGLEAGISASIVPDQARLTLRWREGEPQWAPLIKALGAREPRPDTRLTATPNGRELIVEMKGRAAHSGVNVEGGRNALVSLAHVASDVLPASGIRDMLRFTRALATDIRGAELGLPAPDGLWRGYDVTAATVATIEERVVLTINIRRPPPWTGPDLRAHLTKVVDRYNAENGSRLSMDPSFFFGDEPFAVDPASPLVVRLLESYRRASGEAAAQPAVVGGGTYAKRVPRSIAFGMWFSNRPYPGHDVDEHIPIVDLPRGAHILIEALVDLACAPPLGDAPLRPVPAP